jgi:hypothetical protein
MNAHQQLGADSPRLNSRVDYVFLAFFFILVSHGTGPVPNLGTGLASRTLPPLHSSLFCPTVGSFTTCELLASALRVREPCAVGCGLISDELEFQQSPQSVVSTVLHLRLSRTSFGTELSVEVGRGARDTASFVWGSACISHWYLGV